MEDKSLRDVKLTVSFDRAIDDTGGMHPLLLGLVMFAVPIAVVSLILLAAHLT